MILIIYFTQQYKIGPNDDIKAKKVSSDLGAVEASPPSCTAGKLCLSVVKNPFTHTIYLAHV